jgi:hypothetical protein
MGIEKVPVEPLVLSAIESETRPVVPIFKAVKSRETRDHQNAQLRVDHVLDIFTFYKAFRCTSQVDEHVDIEESDTSEQYWYHLLNR